MTEVLVACRKCSGKSAASAMKLDTDLGMMVCPTCIKNKSMEKKSTVTLSSPMPEQHTQVFSRPAMKEDSSNKVTQKCTKCKYGFKYNPVTKTPSSCPYCNTKIFSW